MQSFKTQLNGPAHALNPLKHNGSQSDPPSTMQNSRNSQVNETNEYFYKFTNRETNRENPAKSINDKLPENLETDMVKR